MKKLIAFICVLFAFNCVQNNNAIASQLLVEAPFFTMDGTDTCASCTVTTYECGTTTAKTTYTSAALSVAQTNPVVLGTDGRSANPIYFEGCVKYVLADSDGTTLDTIDNYYGVGATFAAGVNLSSYSSFHAAIAAIGATETTLWIDTDATMTDNETIPTTLNMNVMKGNTITTTGYTLTIYSPENIQAGARQQIFAGTGDLRFTIGGRINSAWWGLTSDCDWNAGTGTNNASAFAAAIECYKAITPKVPPGDAASLYKHAAQLYIPEGAYLIESGLFLGSDRAGGEGYDTKVDWLFAEPGTIIYGKTNDPVIDLSGGHTCRIDNLIIIGDDGTVPTVGLLLSRSGASGGTDYSASGHRFYNVETRGHFSVAGVYNYASEINLWFGGYLSNAAGVAAYYATYNNAEQTVTSPNTTLPNPDGRSSFGDKFYGTTFMHSKNPSAATDAVVMLETIVRGPHFYGCYFNQGASDDEAYIKFLFADGTSTRNQGAVINGCTFHAGYRCAVYLGGRVANLDMRGCSFGGVPTVATVEVNDADDDSTGVIIDSSYIEAPSIDAKTNMTGNARFLYGCTLKAIYDQTLTSFLKINDDLEGDAYIDSGDTIEIDGTHTGRIILADTGQIIYGETNQNIIYTGKGEPGAGAQTLTAAMLIGGVIQEDPEGNATWTTDTAANIIAAIPNATTGHTFHVVLNSLATAASGEVVTIAGGVGVTMAGETLTLTEGVNTTAILIFRVTGAATVRCFMITG